MIWGNTGLILQVNMCAFWGSYYIVWIAHTVRGMFMAGFSPVGARTLIWALGDLHNADLCFPLVRILSITQVRVSHLMWGIPGSTWAGIWVPGGV